MKKVYSFRLSREAIEKLDKIVNYENDELEKKGIIGLEFTRIHILEMLIDLAFNYQKKGKSLQGLKDCKGDDEK